MTGIQQRITSKYRRFKITEFIIQIVADTNRFKAGRHRRLKAFDPRDKALPTVNKKLVRITGDLNLRLWQTLQSQQQINTISLGGNKLDVRRLSVGYHAAPIIYQLVLLTFTNCKTMRFDITSNHIYKNIKQNSFGNYYVKSCDLLYRLNKTFRCNSLVLLE
jgi:hypothetical protein